MGDLCTACMCSGRNLFYVGETGFYQIYLQILNEIQVTDASLPYTRVCWECLALLRNWQKFKQQVKDSYTQLQYIQQNNFIQLPPEPPRLQIQQVCNISYPDIKTEAEESQTQQEGDREECIKSEEMHCEPATFVNNLKVELKKKKRDSKKVNKPIKEKTKNKLKTKPGKVALKKKIKVKIKHSPSLDSVQDDHLDDDDDIACYDDEEVKGIEIDPVQKEEIAKILKKEDAFDDEAVRLNGELKTLIPSAGAKEVLPERPQCAECGKNFSSRKTYRYHLNVLHKGQNRYPCPRCGKVYQWKSNLGRHLRSHKARDSGELYCETCDKRFASVATYRQHLRVSRRHVPESEFSFMCNDCGKKFVNKTRLRDHIDWEHLKKIKFRCQLCNKPFKCHTSLYVHMQNVHRNKEKKDNLCHVCGKSYQNAAKLKYHIVAMHTSETPYQCQQCSAAFGWYSSLYRHVREVHYKMKVQPKKSKKSKKIDLQPLLPQQVVLGQIHQPGPP